MKKEFVLGFALVLFLYCFNGIANAVVDLSTFVTENYVTSTNGPGNWVVNGTANNLVTQFNNSDASIFRSGGSIDVNMRRITGEFYSINNDDDAMGFVFGFQNRGQMYLFGWKKQTQSGNLAGMYLSLLDTGDSANDPDRKDFFNIPSYPSTVRTILRENTLSWSSFTTYNFILDFRPGQIDISIFQGANELESWSVLDSTFTNGDFGFYNNSQASSTYGNLEVSCLSFSVKHLETGNNYVSLQGAYDEYGVQSFDTFLMTSSDLNENIIFDRDLVVKLKGGYDCDFSSINGVSTVHGSMIIKNGTVIIDKITII